MFRVSDHLIDKHLAYLLTCYLLVVSYVATFKDSSKTGFGIDKKKKGNGAESCSRRSVEPTQSMCRDIHGGEKRVLV